MASYEHSLHAVQRREIYSASHRIFDHDPAIECYMCMEIQRSMPAARTSIEFSPRAPPDLQHSGLKSLWRLPTSQANPLTLSTWLSRRFHGSSISYLPPAIYSSPLIIGSNNIPILSTINSLCRILGSSLVQCIGPIWRVIVSLLISPRDALAIV